jgi:hypothetical protein
MNHLAHYIKWDKLLEVFFVKEGETLELEVGECELIHITDNKTRIMVENRKYLKDLICKDEKCSNIVGKKYFSKGKKGKYVILYCRRQFYDEEKEQRIIFFINSFQKVITEFKETERKKYDIKNIKKNKKVFDNELLKHEYFIKSDKTQYYYRFIDDNNFFNDIKFWKSDESLNYELDLKIYIIKHLIILGRYDSLIYLMKNDFEFEKLFTCYPPNRIYRVTSDYLYFYIQLNLFLANVEKNNDFIIENGEFSETFTVLKKDIYRYTFGDGDDHSKIIIEILDKITVDNYLIEFKNLLKLLFKVLIIMDMLMEDLKKELEWQSEIFPIIKNFGFDIPVSSLGWGLLNNK